MNFMIMVIRIKKAVEFDDKGLWGLRVFVHFCVYMGENKHIRVTQWKLDDNKSKRGR